MSKITADNMQSVTSNAVYNALLSHPIRVWSTVQTVYYNLPVNIPKSFFTTGRTYLIFLCGTYSNAYSGFFIFYNGISHNRTFTVDKTSATVNDLSITSDYVTISFNQATGIGADSGRVDVIML